MTIARWLIVFGCLGFVLGCSSDDSGDPSASGDGGSGDSSASSAGGEPSAEMDDCSVGCVATLAANCEHGPVDQAGCESDCRDLLLGKCGREYTTLQSCAEGEPISCVQGYPAIAACADEQAAFVACLD